MFSILDLGPNVVAYRAEGRLEREDVERVFAEVDRKLALPGDFRVYAEVHSLSGIGLEALWQDLRLSIQRWKAVTRIGLMEATTSLTYAS